MGSSESPVVIRPPAWVRVYVSIFLVVWVGVDVFTTMIRHHGSSVPVGIVFIGFALTLGSRLLSLGVSELANGDLRVRNNVSTRTLRRADVEEFRFGLAGGTRLSGRTVQALLVDATTYSIDVARSGPFLGGNRTSRELALLNRWLHRTPGKHDQRTP